MSGHTYSRADLHIEATRLRFDAIDRLLVLMITLSMLVSFAVALPADLTKPGFSSYILFEDPTFLLPYFLSLLGIGVLWFRQGDKKMISYLLVTAFCLLTVNLWQLKALGVASSNQAIPYGAADTIMAGSLTLHVLQSGHLLFVGYGSYPATYLVGSSFAYVSGLSLVHVIAWSNILLSVLFATLSFLIIDSFTKSHKLAAAVTMLSIIADENLFKQPPYTQYAYGVIFFLIMILIVNMSLTKGKSIRYKAPILIVFASSVLAYSITPFLVILIAIFELLIKRNSVSFPKMLGYAMVAFFAWSLYASFGELLSITNGFLGLFGVNKGSTLLLGTGHSPGYYLLQLLSSNLKSLPYPLGYLLPTWFLVFFGAGTLIWVVSKTLRLSMNVPPASFLAGFLVTGAFIFLDGYPTGTGWPRVLEYMAPFVGAAIAPLFCGMRRGHTSVIFSLILILTLPTVVAYTSDVGAVSTHYQWETNAATFLGHLTNDEKVYFGDNLLTFNYNLFSKLASNPLSPSSGGLTPSDEFAYILSETGDFLRSDGGAVMVVSTLSFSSYIHLYGYKYSSNITALFQGANASSNLVYSSGFVTILQ